MATKWWTSTSSTSFSTAANWSDAAAPVNGDTLIFNGSGTANCSTNLGADLTTVTVIVEPGFTANIGDVTAGVATYLSLDGGTLHMPKSIAGSGAGSPRVLVNFAKAAGNGTVAGTVIMETSNSAGAESFYPPVMVKGGASNTLTITATGGNLGVAVRPGEVSVVASITTTKGSAGAPSVYLGAGVTLTSGVFEDGTIESRVAATSTTVRISGATYNVSSLASGAHTTIHVDAGKLTYNGSGTITTLNDKGVTTFKGDGRVKTVTTCTTYKGSTLDIDNGVPGGIVFTNAINHNDGIGGTGCNFITPAFVKGTLITQ